MRLTLALALVAVFTLAGAAVATARSAGDAAPVMFRDPGGDSGTAADITTVGVSNDDKGLYQFDVGFATPYGDAASLFLYLDTDRDTTTGNPNIVGSDYLLVDDHHEHTVWLYKWTGSDWSDASSTSTVDVTIAADNLDLTASIDKSDLGNASGFDFVLFTFDGEGTEGHYDDAPSGTGAWKYNLQETFELGVAASRATAARAGATWTVMIAVSRSDTGKTVGSEGSISCKGTSGTTKLVLAGRAFVSGGGGGDSAATCTFKVPKQLRHKSLNGTITVSFHGRSVTKSFRAMTR